MGHRVLFCTLTLAAVLLVSGCPQQPPEVRIAETRNQYFLEPTGMLIQEIEVSAEDFEGGEAAEAEAEAEADDTAADDEEGTADPQAPRTVKILFDLVIRFDGLRESLPGITVEISHTDPFGKEKARYLQWVETEGMSKGDARQLSFEREIPDYVDGDEFAIEFREQIPREEWADYREFESVTSAP